MDFEKQKPVSDEYRENWEHIFRPLLDEAEATAPENVTAIVIGDEHGNVYAKRSYPNGCPMLNESEHA